MRHAKTAKKYDPYTRKKRKKSTEIVLEEA
jgi:hypothetical protein